jgi:hypothetical protein
MCVSVISANRQSRLSQNRLPDYESNTVASHRALSNIVINSLQPSGYYMHHQVWHLQILRSTNSTFMCFVWISEQTAIISLHSIKWLVFITEM